MSTAIINMALDLLDEEAIISSSDNRTAVRWMNRNYDPLRDSLLRLHPWNFAKARALLPARAAINVMGLQFAAGDFAATDFAATPLVVGTQAGGPAFGFRYAYPKPADCLRVLPLADLGARNGTPTDFAVEGSDILTNAGSPLAVQYIKRVTDDTAFDALFTQYLAATLATRAANFITGKQSYAERVGQIAQDLKMTAQMVNGLEGVPETIYADDWVRGRHTGVAYDGDPYSVGSWY